MSHLCVLVVTFNCARQPVLSDIFAAHLERFTSFAQVPDLIVFSLQEVAPIAYAFLGGPFLKSYLDRVREAIANASSRWAEARELGGGFVEIDAMHVGMTALLVFARQDVSREVRCTAHAGTGLGVLQMGNKGAVGCRLSSSIKDGDEGHGTLSLTFIAAHLAPMEGGTARRNLDWANIVRRLVFQTRSTLYIKGIAFFRGLGLGRGGWPSLRTKSTRHFAGKPSPAQEQQSLLQQQEDPSDHQAELSGVYDPSYYTILAGDLNYRTSSKPPSRSDSSAWPVPTAEHDNRHYSKLLTQDQLSHEVTAGRTLHGFWEEPIAFPPTYKYSDSQRAKIKLKEGDPSEGQVGHGLDEDDFGWATHRWPSWCDRILLLDRGSQRHASDEAPRLHVQRYGDLPLMSTSDHRPVAMLLSVRGQPAGSFESGEGFEGPTSPFEIDQHWRLKRIVARVCEVIVGVTSYLVLTWEGRVAVLVIALAVLLFRVS